MLIDTPVAWLTRNSSSITSEVSLAGMAKADIAEESLLMSSFSPKRSPAAMTCSATVSSSSPVRPRRVLRSATVDPASSNVVGTVVATFWALFSRLSRASPVAPVPARMVSDMPSNSAPMSYSALPTPIAAVPRAAAINVGLMAPWSFSPKRPPNLEPPSAPPSPMASPADFPADFPAPAAAGRRMSVICFSAPGDAAMSS